ncbi:DUF2169 domain-containing protein [Cellvibrio sp. UBA7661]|uniref:DUF2169 family type VI secretion system accessory protein n=1 Tax=Cellvibrio sp. UBA7661 TaxID=1946311 RepID=UPI002F3508DC
MDLLNGSPFVLDTHQAMDKTGQKYIVALVKATYDFPKDATSLPRLAKTQTPIYAADVFEGEPGFSSPIFESDYGLRKARCDVVINATAYAPQQQPVAELLVGMRVHECQKVLRVVGDRTWQGFLGLSPSAPELFTEMPISYSRAFGGSLPPQNEKDSGISYAANPVGCGYAKGKHTALLKGTKVPNLEHPDKPIRQCDGNYQPYSLGPIGRSWEPRLSCAGTYDDDWKENTFPLLPADFDEAFFQCTPKDQQIPFPVGGEAITLMNLHPTRERIHFLLPDLEMPMVLLTKQHIQHKLKPVVDCLTLNPDKEEFTLLWRAHFPIKRSLNEILTVAIGKISQCKWRSLVMGTGTCSGEIEPDNADDVVDVTDAMDNCSDCGLSA